MNANFYSLFLLILLASCVSETKIDAKESSIVKPESQLQADDFRPSPISPKAEPKFLLLSEILGLIDSLYGTQDSQKIDTIDLASVDRTRTHELGLKGFEYGKGVLLRNYGKFEFLTFPTSSEADSIFSKILRIAEYQPWEKGGEPKESFVRTFSKSGCMFVLYDNMIFYHRRACHLNYDEEKKLEDVLLNEMFNSDFPNSVYYVGSKCGWNKVEKRKST